MLQKKKWLLWKKESKMPRKDRMRSLLRSRIHKVEWGLWTVNTGPQKVNWIRRIRLWIQQKKKKQLQKTTRTDTIQSPKKNRKPWKMQKKPWIPLINLQWKLPEQKDSLTAWIMGKKCLALSIMRPEKTILLWEVHRMQPTWTICWNPWNLSTNATRSVEKKALANWKFPWNWWQNHSTMQTILHIPIAIWKNGVMEKICSGVLQMWIGHLMNGILRRKLSMRLIR